MAMANKIVTVTGATGHVGKALAARLKADGHEVRMASRTFGIGDDDAQALASVFFGADAAYIMIPPDFAAADVRARANELGAKLATAVKGDKVKRVVFLSSINAHLAAKTGPILGLRDMELRLNGLDIPELVHLRPAYFMENLIGCVENIARRGRCSTALRPDIAIPMIATRDIAKIAAEILLEEPFAQPRVRELLGAAEVTMAQAARALGAAIGRPDLKYEQMAYEDAKKVMIAQGLTPGYADAMNELSRHMNETMIQGAEERSPRNTTPTTLEAFAVEVFKPAFERSAAHAP